MLEWREIDAALERAGGPILTGRVTRAVGTTAEVAMPGLQVGALVEVLPGDGGPARPPPVGHARRL